MSRPVWDARKARETFELYIHDYLVKKGCHRAAEIFKREAAVDEQPILLEAPDGFLHEWWTLFYDTYRARELEAWQREGQSSNLGEAQSSHQGDQNNDAQSTAHSAVRGHRQMPSPVPFSPESSTARQSAPLSSPDSSSPPEEISSQPGLQSPNQGRQLVLTPNASSNRITGSDTMNINSLRVPRSILPLSVDSDAVGLNQPLQFRQVLGFFNSTGPVVHFKRQFPRSTNFQRRRPMLPRNFSENEAQNNRRRRRLVQPVAGENTVVDVDQPPEANMGRANAEGVDDIESFLSSIVEGEGDGGTPLGALRRGSASSSMINNTGFTFEEIFCLSLSKSKVVCCHFSSDGKLLASAGHDKKVFLLNMETYDFAESSECHCHIVTDVRFRPNSTILASSSFDRTVRIWDAGKPSKSLFKLRGHAEQVMALDFHPRKIDLLCSCDGNDEIRLWNVNRGACIRVSKGASKQVRFQPQTGKLLATATGNVIKVIDTETRNCPQFSLKGHEKEVLCLSWDRSGTYLASVSEDSARVWSLVSGGKCISELRSIGNKFRSCAFHPGYSTLLIIGSYQSLELWNPIEGSKTVSVAAHSGLITGLADSIENEMIASASHDRCVRIWK